MMTDLLDCVIVGAGPAGLTAAIYLARFNLALRIVDAGASRCATIPRTRNHAGYPGGVVGAELLRRMREQAAEFDVVVLAGHVDHIGRGKDDTFLVEVNGETLRARTVLLATGVVNHRPPMSDADHDRAVASGLLRYCPICDGYEVIDRVVGVVGIAGRGYNEAMFLRMYTKHLTLITPDPVHTLTEAQRRSLDDLGVRVVDGPLGDLRIEDERIVAPTDEGDLRMESIYPALGSLIRSELAVALGAEASDDGCLMVDDHQRTSLRGLYAAGDVSKGLDQISHAMGEAGVAATTIRNDLAETRVLARA